MDFPIVLVRFNEIALKSRNTRSGLRRLLRHNISTALKMNGVIFHKIEDTWERLIIYTNESGKVADLGSKVFGVASTSPVLECTSDIQTISRTVSDMAKETLKKGESFAIRAHRVGKHGFNTREVAVACGSSVIEVFRKNGITVKVNLDSPDHEFYVEVRGKRTFIYDTVIQGVGGLPLGSQGRVISCLINFESILSTWLMMKRGCTPILVLFSPQEKETDELINVATSSLLPFAAGKLPITEVSLNTIMTETNSTPLIEECLRCLAMKIIAELESAEGIVSSRRLNPSDESQWEVIRKCTEIANFPVFYPLAGLNDTYLSTLAKRIGGITLCASIEKETSLCHESHNNRESGVKCDPDLIVQHYQERIRKLVMKALGEHTSVRITT